ncbi:MAG: hypothetical protein PHU85_08075 [Phycisphaerae bacterium]|nr:hypothetical protein [Phycisphaerae bacterium]
MSAASNIASVPRLTRRPFRRRGFSSLIATFYVALFSGLAIAFVAFSSLNSAIAGNARAEQAALTAAESGLSIVRYRLSEISLNVKLSPTECFAAIGQSLSDAFNGTVNLGGRSVSASGTRVYVPPINVDLNVPGANFDAEIVPVAQGYQVTVTGAYGTVRRPIRILVVEQLGPVDNSIMKNGIVSRGSVHMNGSATLHSNVPGGAAIMSLDPDASPPIHVGGSGVFDGDFYMVKPDVTASQVVGGSALFLNPETGYYESNAAAHVHSGVAEPQFPRVNTAVFDQLIATLPKTTITSESDLTHVSTLHNTLIRAGTNPRFQNGMTITGLVYIEWPNNVTFGGSVNLTGMIVCQPPPFEPSIYASPTNDMIFNGAINSSGAENLPDTPEYAGLRSQKGTFLLAKDYEVLFNGAMGTVNGSIYASDLTMNGATTGTVRGSILVDRRVEFVKNGSTNVMFQVSADAQLPSGLEFDQFKTLHMQSGSYQEL